MLKKNPFENVEGIKGVEKQKQFLSLEELQKLAITPFRFEELRRAALFAALTGLRRSDILKLTWREIQHSEDQGYYIRFRQQKTSSQETLPISDEAVELLGTRGDHRHGSQSAALLTAVIGNIKDFDSEGKLASYFGVVPSVSNSNQSVRHGHITKHGNKAARTALLQCALVAKKFSDYLKQFYDSIKERRGSGKAKIALARKFLVVIYHTLKNDWMFTDFTKFEKVGS